MLSANPQNVALKLSCFRERVWAQWNIPTALKSLFLTFSVLSKYRVPTGFGSPKARGFYVFVSAPSIYPLPPCLIMVKNKSDRKIEIIMKYCCDLF